MIKHIAKKFTFKFVMESDWTMFINFFFFRATQSPHKHGPTPTPYHDWDYLMFSQRWPITACIQWENENKANTCNMPMDKSTWIVHGIWPTKIGTEGPLYCPSSIHFDPDFLAPIMDELNAQWTNVEANTKPNSFWKHEWEKHGTCASVLPALNSVPNFFKQGLEWNNAFKLHEILADNTISPNPKGYTINEIYTTVKGHINADPMIQCVTDPHTKQSLLSEIRICFNKSMNIIDCDQSNNHHSRRMTNMITNCSLKKPVMYFAEVPAKHVAYEIDYVDEFFKKRLKEELYYMSIYRFLKFLIWFTT